VYQLEANVALLCVTFVVIGCANPEKPAPVPPVHWVSPADSARWTQSQQEGNELLAAHQNGEAEQAFADALDALREGSPRDPRADVTIDSLLQVCRAYSASGQWVDLERVSRLVLVAEVVRSSSDPRVRLLARKSLITSLQQQKRYDEALATATEGYEEAAYQYPPDSPPVLEWLYVEASAYADAGRFVDAEPGLRHVLEQWTESAGSHTPAVEAAQNQLAWCLAQQGRPLDAEPFAQRSVAGFSKISPAPRELADSLDTLGEIERQLGHSAEAEQSYRQAAVIYRRFRPQADSQLADVLDHLSALLRASGRTDEADAFNREILAIRSDITERSQPNKIP